MNAWLNTDPRASLWKNRKKGFTLIELIVVIVILAILIAALTPAVLGTINRANIAADEADCRTVMMAASVAALSEKPPQELTAQTIDNKILGALTGANNLPKGTYTVYFDGPVAIGCSVAAGTARSNAQQSVGDTSGTGIDYTHK